MQEAAHRGGPYGALPFQEVRVGGKHLGYMFRFIWTPLDYLRFLAPYGDVDIPGAPRAATADPDGPLNARRKYGVDTAAVRAQLEF